MFSPRRILVPTDFTEDSDRALRKAVDIAESSHAEVYLLHVDQFVPVICGDCVLDQNLIATFEENNERNAREQMFEEIRRVSQAADVNIQIDERHGVTFEVILDYVRDKLIDLVVIEPHKKGVLNRFLGGVTERLMKETTCPILVLPSET